MEISIDVGTQKHAMMARLFDSIGYIARWIVYLCPSGQNIGMP